MVVNDVKGLKLEFHILQSFPVTCLNRDDVGAPKTAIVGGSLRARVSSQSWKRAVRTVMKQLAKDQSKMGLRTKYISSLISQKCKELGAPENIARECGNGVAKLKPFSGKKEKKGEIVSDTLLFISPSEVEKICLYLKEKGFNFKEIKESDIKPLLDLEKHRKGIDAYDIALFGRMVAVEPILNIEGATSFSHAISTHKVSNEVDFFTAVDDVLQRDTDETGSGHMGMLEYNSATYYRYVGVNITQLYETLAGDMDMIKDAIELFIRALFLAIPEGKQASMSGLSGWDFARIYLRKGQGLQIMFDKAIFSKNGLGYLESSKDILKSKLDEKEKLYASLFGKIASFEFGENTDYTIDNLVLDILTHLESQITK